MKEVQFFKSKKSRSIYWRYPFLISLVINILILSCYFIFMELRYESNDDYSISNQITGADFLNVNYVNYYLCKFISLCQSILPEINCFVLSQIVFSFVALTVITSVLIDSCRGGAFSLMIIAVTVVYAYDHFFKFQFTKTSALIITTGAIFIVYVFHEGKKNYYSIIGIFFILLGSAYRYGNVKAVMVTSIMFLLAYIVVIWINQQSNKNNKLKKNEGKKRSSRLEVTKNRRIVLRIFFCLLISYILSFCLMELSKIENNSHDELEAYRTYNSYRSKIADYPIPEYDENVEFYESLGLSKNDLTVLKSFGYYDVDGVASIENLKAIAEKQKQTPKRITLLQGTRYWKDDTKKSLQEKSSRGIHIYLIIIVGFIGMLTRQKSWSLFLITIGISFIAMYIYLFYIGRAPYRATYVIDISSMIFLIYSMRIVPLRSVFEKKIFYKNKIAYIGVFLISVVTSLILVNSMNQNIVDSRNNIYNSDVLTEHIRENRESFFIFDTSTSSREYKSNLIYYNDPLKIRPPDDNKNMVSFGGWSTNSPPKNKIIADNDLKNIYGDIIDNDKVYVISAKLATEDVSYHPEIIQYFNDEYAKFGERIVFVLVQELGGFMIWQVKTDQFIEGN